jgi:hypothetical protein
MARAVLPDFFIQKLGLTLQAHSMQNNLAEDSDPYSERIRMADYMIMLNEEERVELIGILEREVAEDHAEFRRSEAPDYREMMKKEEQLVRRLLEKVKHSASETVVP